jgi:hypothetical protein
LDELCKTGEKRDSSSLTADMRLTGQTDPAVSSMLHLVPAHF